MLAPWCAQARRVRKYERSPKARILEALSKFVETSRRGTGSVIGAPEQTSHSSSHCQPRLDTSHPKRPRHAGLEFVCVFGHDALDAKCAGARSAGNPHAACEEAGAGNGLTVWLVRHSQRKRGATDRPRLRGTAPALDPTGVRVTLVAGKPFVTGRHGPAPDRATKSGRLPDCANSRPSPRGRRPSAGATAPCAGYSDTAGRGRRSTPPRRPRSLHRTTMPLPRWPWNTQATGQQRASP